MSFNLSRMKYSFLIIIILILIMLGLPAYAASVDVQNAKSGVVCVVLTDKSQNTVKWGSGFAIGQRKGTVQYIVTNNHVIADAELKGYIIKVYYSESNNKYEEAKIVFQSDEKDIAVLKLVTPVSELKVLPVLQSDGVTDAETVYALGFPGNTFEGSDFKNFNRTDITITGGIVSNRVIQLGAKCFQIDASISAGNSGGPLINQKGQVIGINTRSLEQNGNINYAITVDELIPLLKQYNIPFELVQKNIIQYILIFLCALLILIVLSIILLYKRKKAKLLKNKEISNKENQILTKPKPVNSSSVFIYGLTGKYGNNRFGVRNGKLVMGSDASSCDIMFPPETEGIAPRHCEISFDSESKICTIKDLDSIYGTFINDNKLQPYIEVVIHSGDIFYLFNRKNMFKIRIE